MEKNSCLFCKQEFSDKNIFTEAGWRETKISGMCEKCFDDCCGEDTYEDEVYNDYWSDK